jgi:hypothetical protein
MSSNSAPARETMLHLSKHHTLFLECFAFVLTLGTSNCLSAQAEPDAGKLPIVKYRAGHIEAQWIPYGRRWVLRGFPVTSIDTATLITGEVIPQARNGRESLRNVDAGYSRACWQHPIDKTAPDSFNLVFGEQHLGRRYTVRLAFYSPMDTATAEGIIDPAITAAYDTAYQIAIRDRHLPPDSVRPLFVERVQSSLRAAAASGEVAFLQSAEEGRCDPGQPVVELSRIAAEELAEAALVQMQRDSIARDLEMFEDSIRQMRATPEHGLLLTALEQISKSGDPVLTSQHHAAYVQAVSPGAGNALPTSTLLALLDFSTNRCLLTTPLTTQLCELLAKSLSFIGRRDRSASALEQLVQRLAELAPLTKTRVQIKGVFLPRGRALIQVTSWDDAQATSDKLRIGTTMGFGLTSLATSDEARGFGGDREAFVQFALKFYGYGVDKSLPDPYLGQWLARWSLMLGMIRSPNLRFRGQALGGFAKDVFPTAGISFDITRDFTLQLGSIFFRQPSVYPGTAERNRVRMAPMMGLGFDFDGANRLSKIFGNLIPQ